MRPDDPTAVSPPNDWLTEAQLADAKLVAACIDKAPSAIEHLVTRCSEAIKRAAAQALLAQALVSEAPASSLADGDDLYQEFCFELTRRPRQLLAGFRASYAAPGQDTRCLKSGFGGRSPLDCWIFGVALRICRKKLRLRKYRWLEHSVQIDYVDPEALPIQCYDISLDEFHADALLMSVLGKRDRFLIQARFGLTPFDTPWRMVDIAKQLRWSVPTTYAHLERALDELRAYMKLQQDS
jgi:hypothetical protein